MISKSAALLNAIQKLSNWVALIMWLVSSQGPGHQLGCCKKCGKEFGKWISIPNSPTLNSQSNLLLQLYFIFKYWSTTLKNWLTACYVKENFSEQGFWGGKKRKYEKAEHHPILSSAFYVFLASLVTFLLEIVQGPDCNLRHQIWGNSQCHSTVSVASSRVNFFLKIRGWSVR